MKNRLLLLPFCWESWHKIRDDVTSKTTIMISRLSWNEGQDDKRWQLYQFPFDIRENPWREWNIPKSVYFIVALKAITRVTHPCPFFYMYVTPSNYNSIQFACLLCPTYCTYERYFPIFFFLLPLLIFSPQFWEFPLGIKKILYRTKHEYYVNINKKLSTYLCILLYFIISSLARELRKSWAQLKVRRVSEANFAGRLLFLPSSYTPLY